MTLASKAIFDMLRDATQTKHWSTQQITSVMTALTRVVPPYKDHGHLPPINVKIALQLSGWYIKRAFPRTATGNEILTKDEEHLAVWTPAQIVSIMESLATLNANPYRVMDIIAYELSAPDALTRWSLSDVARLAYAYGRVPSVTAAMIANPIIDDDDDDQPLWLTDPEGYDANQMALMIKIGDRIMSQPSLTASGCCTPKQLVHVLFSMAVHRAYHPALFKACETYFTERWSTNIVDMQDKALLHMVTLIVLVIYSFLYICSFLAPRLKSYSNRYLQRYPSINPHQWPIVGHRQPFMMIVWQQWVVAHLVMQLTSSYLYTHYMFLIQMSSMVSLLN
jgi:hypothetical protein